MAVESQQASAGDIARRAIGGAFALVARGLILRVISFVGWFALAWVLGPSDFGMLAFGAAILAAATVLSDGGLGAALIRGSGEPDPKQLRAALGLQFLGAMVAASVGASLIMSGGGVAEVTGVLLLAVPITMLKMPALVLTERRLDYRPVLAADVSETLVFFGLGYALATSGLGPMGVAIAGLAKASVGAATLWFLVPGGRCAPTLRIGPARKLLRFGLSYQGTGVIALIRDQVLNGLLLGISGRATLGHWALATRAMELPFIIYQALWRVSYPAMSRLNETGRDMRGVVRSAASTVGILSALGIAPLVATVPLGLPLLLGSAWTDAAAIAPLGLMTLLVSGPASVAASGFLYARGHARDVLVASAVASAVGLIVAASLLAPFGLWGVALSLPCAGFTEAALFTVFIWRRAHVALAMPIALPALCGAASGLAGLAVAQQIGGWSGVAIGGVTAVSGLAGLGSTVCRRDTLAVVGLMKLRSGHQIAHTT